MTAQAIAPAERELLPDALRGLALGGILLVNVMSFASGLGLTTLGRLYPDGPLMDHIVFVLVAFLAEFKFYPVFSFLFGYGFALFWDRARRRGPDASRLFDRRIGFLAIIGILHGTLLWFGDILSRYAMVAVLFKAWIKHGPKRLLKSLKGWLIATVAVTVFTAVGAVLTAAMLTATPGLAELQLDATAAERSVYAYGSYGDQFVQRIGDYMLITFSFVFFIPQVMVLFLLGAFVARAGWLRHVARHRDKWQRVLKWSLIVGIPVNVVWAVLQYANALDPSSWFQVPATLLSPVLLAFSVTLVAGGALLSEYSQWQPALRRLAAAGRMPLTNYIAQSVLCSLFLYSYGLGLGDSLGHAQLAGLAVGIYGLQLLWSPLWLARFQQGPLETLWRRFVYAPR